MNFTAARSESSIIHVFPFNSEKKRGGVAVQTVHFYYTMQIFYLYSRLTETLLGSLYIR